MGDKAVKGKDVGHKDNNPLNNDPDNLRNEDPSKNRREPRLREDNLDEMAWYRKVMAKIDQLTHPKGYATLDLRRAIYLVSGLRQLNLRPFHCPRKSRLHVPACGKPYS